MGGGVHRDVVPAQALAFPDRPHHLDVVRQAQRLLRVLEQEGGLPVDDLPRLPSGRAVPEAADEQFPIYKAAVEADPDSWRAWFLLGLAYDASGDRSRARWATRESIRLERA